MFKVAEFVAEYEFVEGAAELVDFSGGGSMEKRGGRSGTPWWCASEIPHGQFVRSMTTMDIGGGEGGRDELY